MKSNVNQRKTNSGRNIHFIADVMFKAFYCFVSTFRHVVIDVFRDVQQVYELRSAQMYSAFCRIYLTSKFIILPNINSLLSVEGFDCHITLVSDMQVILNKNDI